MASTTFHNLAPEKQARIIDAAFTEFSIHTLEEASISNILKALGMARGTFYRYFDDIEDLYFYIFSLKSIDLDETLLRCSQAGTLDFISLSREYVKVIATAIYDGRFRSYYQNFFGSWSDRRSDMMRRYMPKGHYNIQSMIGIFAEYNLTADELADVHHLIRVVSHNVINRSFVEEWTAEEFTRRFMRYMTWIHNGLVANGEA